MSGLLAECIVPDWPAPAGVGSLVTTRGGGVSTGAYASLNLGDHVGDASRHVTENRRRLAALLPAPPRWLRQVHGTVVVKAEDAGDLPEADAAVSRAPGTVCGVLTADCLPVLLCDEAASVVGIAHAGWRGLCAGVVERTVEAMDAPGERLLAYLGPAIGPDSFEVGGEVRDAFLAHDKRAAFAFAPRDNGRWLADLYLLARQRLDALGVRRVYSERACTFSEPQRFFSYRRDRDTGRMAALIWLGEPPARL